MTNFYDKYHKKNRNIQKNLIDSRNFTYKYLLKFIIQYLKKGDVVCDIGCGVGTIDFYMSNYAKKIYGFDVSDRAIMLANQSKESIGIKNISFYVADDKRFKSYVSGKVDLVVCSEVIEHVKNDVKLLEQIFTILNSDGTLILSTPLLNAPLYKLGLLNNFDKSVGHLRRYSVENLEKIIKKIGYEVVEVQLTEGIIRNFLYTHDNCGWLLKFYKWPFYLLPDFIDEFISRFVGFSNVYIIAKKI